jgi:hypothetical protein
MRGKPIVAIGIALVMAASAGACAGRTDNLGTVAGACFRAVPPAETAIHNKGKLAGVRRISSAALRARLTHDVSLSTLPQESLCVFAFNGTYAPGSVTGARNTTTGHYAVVAVGAEHPDVVAAFVVNQLPTRFRHTH